MVIEPQKNLNLIYAILKITHIITLNDLKFTLKVYFVICFSLKLHSPNCELCYKMEKAFGLITFTIENQMLYSNKYSLKPQNLIDEENVKCWEAGNHFSQFKYVYLQRIHTADYGLYTYQHQNGRHILLQKTIKNLLK